MNARTRWPVSIPRERVRQRHVDPPLEQTTLYRINPQRAIELEAQGTKKRSSK